MLIDASLVEPTRPALTPYHRGVSGAIAGAPGGGLAERLLREAREHDAAGRPGDAIRSYTLVIDGASEVTDARVLAEATRRLAMIHFGRHEHAEALSLLGRSVTIATMLADDALAAEALNGIAVVHIAREEWELARLYLQRALTLGATSDNLRGFIEQNLGTMANIQGEVEDALSHYQRSLLAFRRAGNERGCAIAYHNLGMNTADRELWDEADRYFAASLSAADAMGDVALRGHTLLNHTEVHLARGRYEEARSGAEEALRIFDQLGARDGKSAAYKFLGVMYRETGRPALAEERLRVAIELAGDLGAAAPQAEATREMAILFQQQGRSQDALRLLNSAHGLFNRLNARRDLIDVAARVAELERVYLEIVGQWGRSIESADSYTFGHSERVARYGAALAGTLGFDDSAVTTVRIGAYLHDLGKVRVPHEILNKPGRLTSDEFAVMQRHPEFGIEMLASIEFPWEIKPIINYHHEKVDGTGYPLKMRGDEIPVFAQAICIVDVFDALTTTRSYRPAMGHTDAIAEMRRSEHWWRRDVFDAFMASVGRGVAA